MFFPYDSGKCRHREGEMITSSVHTLLRSRIRTYGDYPAGKPPV